MSGDVSEAGEGGGGREADSVTSAEESSDMRPKICLESKAIFLLSSWHSVRHSVKG